MFQTILFDLDGTLTDSAEGIAKSVQHALKTLGIDEPDTKKLRCFAGPPLRAQFIKYAHLTEEQADQAVAAYREYYRREGMYENALYPGIDALLYFLKRAGATVGVITSKEASRAVEVLRRFNLSQFIDVVIGVRPEDINVPRSSLVEQALRALGRQNRRGDAVMVGDRFYDIEGAKGAGIASVGVTWGAGSMEELRDAGADALAGDPNMLREILFSGGRPGINMVPGYGGNRSGGIMGAVTAGQKIRMVVNPLLVWLGISLLVSAVGGGIYGLIYSIRMVMENGTPDPSQAYSIASQLLKSPEYLMVTNVISLLTDLVLVPILYSLYKKDVYRRNGIRTSLKRERKPGAVNAVLALLMGFSISVVINVLISLSGVSEWMYEMNPSRYDLMASMPLWLEFIIICLLAPVVEELLFRAIIFRRMRTFTTYTAAAFVSAALFGLVHMDIVTGVAAFIIGIIMAMLYEYTGSIFTSMLFHFGFNFYSIVITLLKLEEMSDSAATTVVIIMLAVSVLAFTAAMAMFMKKNKATEPKYL